jgi:hypothetical protein
VLDKEDMDYDQVTAVGDLAVTDVELEKIGITQLGLRIAILLVIKSIQQQ